MILKLIISLLLLIPPPLKHSPVLTDPGQSGMIPPCKADLASVGVNLWSHVNEYRRRCGLRTLPMDESLNASAYQHAKWMADNQSFQHSPQAVGYNVTIGENIGRGETSSREVVDDWISSVGHSATMRGRWSKMGLAFAKDSNDVWYWVLQFSN